MKVRAQVGMVLNLDKCIGCHTCSITCKNVWTNRDGVEYALVQQRRDEAGDRIPPRTGRTKPDGTAAGSARNQASCSRSKDPNGGSSRRYSAILICRKSTTTMSRSISTTTISSPPRRWKPSRRRGLFPRSPANGSRRSKKGRTGEEILGGEFSKRSRDYNFEGVQKDIYGEYENTFMMYLPRLCEHCLNPSCAASCPSGAIYKREEDGIVLIDQEKCRGWRMCVSGCPYKKVYYNWETGKSEKCTFCYPRIESGNPTVCSETCVGRIRYIGVMLYDADKIQSAANVERETDLYEAHLGVFLDPNDPQVISDAFESGVPGDWIKAAQASPIWKMAMDWKVAFPLHPEYRTLPMVWYIPPLSPIQNAAETGAIETAGAMPDVRSLRIPVRYLANLLTAGDEEPVVRALERMLAMRAFMRSKFVEGVIDESIPARVGLTSGTIEDMYKIMALADYEDRFVIPTTHREHVEEAYDLRGGCGFTDGNRCSTGMTQGSLFGGSKRPLKIPARA